MATLSGGDLTNLRTTRHSGPVYLSVMRPATLLTAQINGTFARGARSLNYDSGTGTGFSTIEAGQVLEIETVFGVEWVRIKSVSGNQVSGVLGLDENPILTADNQVIRVKHQYTIVAAPPSIRSGVFFKFFDEIYSGQNLTPNPVAIAGPARAGFLSAGSIAFALDASPSYVIAAGATISSYLWSCVHNGGGTTGVSFSSTTSATPTLTITEAGQYWLKLRVTDSNGNVANTYRALFVYSRGVTDPYKDFTVGSVSGDWQQGGWRCTVQATGLVTASDFPDGTLCVIWYENKFNDTAGFVNLWGAVGQNIIMAGYLRNDSSNDNFDKGTGTVSFEVTTPEAVIDSITLLGTVSLNYHAAPTTWYQLANMTVGRAVHHLLKWHSWVFETCDVLGLTDNTLKVKNIDLSEDSLLQMINGLSYGRGIFAKLVSSRLGRLHFVVDSQMLNTAGRAALDTTFTLTAADISGVVDVMRQAEETLGTAELDGFSFDGTTGTPFISICPGYRESSISYGFPKFRGTGTDKRSGQVLIDQTDSNEKVGRVLAVANNDPREFRFNCRGNYLGAFDIVPDTGWYAWGVASADLKRQLAYNGKKLVSRHIDIPINVQAGTIGTSVVLEPEALGPDGIQGNYPVGYPTPPLRVPTWDTGGAGIAEATEAIVVYTTGTSYTRLVTLNPLALGSEVDMGIGAAFGDGGTLACLSATKAIVVWADNSVFHARTLTVSGGTVVVGADQLLFDDVSGSTDSYAVVGVTSTTALLVFDDQRTGQDCSAVVLTISGDTITIGTIEVVEVGHSPFGVTVSRIDATRYIAAWQNAASGNRGWANIMTVTGDDVNGGTSAQFVAGAVAVRAPSIDAISATEAVVFYGRATGSYLPSAKPLYGISGSTWSLGNENVLDAAHVLFDPVLISRRKNTKISPTKSVIGYKEVTNDEQYLVAVRYGDTVGGLAAGNVLKIDDNGGVNYSFEDYPAISSVSGSKVVVAYVTEGGVGVPAGRILTATINTDLSITNDGNQIALSASALQRIDLVALRNIV